MAQHDIMKCFLYTFRAPDSPWGEIKVARLVAHDGRDFRWWSDQYVADHDPWITGMLSCAEVQFVDDSANPPCGPAAP